MGAFQDVKVYLFQIVEGSRGLFFVTYLCYLVSAFVCWVDDLSTLAAFLFFVIKFFYL